MNTRHWFFLAVLAALLGAPAGAAAQEKEPPPAATKTESDSCELRIEVTGGEDKKPVDSASVYIRFYEQRRLRRDQKRELNLKTNPEGWLRVPPVPKGKVLIQVIAPGWRTYGKWYDLEKDEETIHINLERPRRWY